MDEWLRGVSAARIAVPLFVCAAGLISGCLPIGGGYPDVVVAPDVVGPIEESRDDDPSDTGAWFAVVDGQEVRIDSHEDRALQRATDGDLLIFGSDPERWYLGADASEDGRCYLVRAWKAYDEPDAVVLVYSEWVGVGIRLPKAPAFDSDSRTVDDPDRRPQYDGISGVTFCADSEGRLTGLWP